MSKERILLLGGSGMVGTVFARVLADQFKIIDPTHGELNVTKAADIRRVVKEVAPNCIINCAALADVDACQKDRYRAYKVNAYAPGMLAWEMKGQGIPVCHISTDYVFDGHSIDKPYTEEDETSPLSVYGRSKRLGEKRVLAASPDNLIVRTIMPYCNHFDRKGDIARTPARLFAEGKSIKGVVDQLINPVRCEDLAWAVCKLIQARESGIWHTGALDYTTPEAFFKKIAKALGFSEELVEPVTFAEFSAGRDAPRPQNSWLDCTKFQNRFGKGTLHTIDQSIEQFAAEYKAVKT